MSAEHKNNIPVLDSLRAFAALSVCLFHYVCTTTGFIQGEGVKDLFSIGIYGVQLFFVISGFVIPWAMYNAGFRFSNFFRFLFKRLLRLEPPYIVSVLLALFILYAKEKFFGMQTGGDLSYQRILLHLGYLIPFFEQYEWLNTVYWTLAVEFQYYLLIALLFIPLIRMGLMFRVFVYAGIIAASFIGGKPFLPYWLPVFMLGILLFLFKSKRIADKEYYIVSVLMFGFCAYKYELASLVYIIIPVIAVLYFSQYKIKGLHFLGKTSYSIYLIHPLIGGTFINILSHSVHHPLMKAALILAGVIITLVSAYIMYLLVEKPSKKLSASISYKLS
ncbi:MAG TPA: acyltransferase [Bacteroidia bacterium]